jgi:Ser/Thr protein kinase RdoA (MazF antagonist)
VREEPLPGNATTGVVRVGNTVRRPSGPWTDAVDAFLAHLHEVGFAGAPRPLGRDERGRQVLEYLPGEIGAPDPQYTSGDLGEIGRMLRDFHQASAGFVPPPAARWGTLIPPDRVELVVHHDPAPWNLVRRPRGWALIDWDAAGPGSRLWDLAYAVQTAVPLRAERAASASLTALRALVDGYGLDDAERIELVELLPRRAEAMVTMLRSAGEEGRQPWSRIWAEDGAFWQSTARHLADHRQDWARGLLA